MRTFLIFQSLNVFLSVALPFSSSSAVVIMVLEEGKARIPDTRMTPWHFDLFLPRRLVVLTGAWWGKGKQTSRMKKNSRQRLEKKLKTLLSTHSASHSKLATQCRLFKLAESC